MSRGKRSLNAMIDDWTGEKVTVNNENWYSTIIANKGENGIATTASRISDLEAQLEELKTKKKRRKLKIKVKM